MKWINCWAPFVSETIYCEDRYLRDQPSLCQFELSPSDFCLDFCLSVKENF
jgi:hypothetical protein